jgi:hypothetical protein
VRRQPSDPQRHAEDSRQHNRQPGGLQRALDAGDDVVLPDVRGDERLPFRPLELAFGPQFDADENEYQDHDQHGEHGRDDVADLGARARCVEEYG